MHVAQILRAKGRDVVTVGKTATVAEAARVLKDKFIGAVVVTRANGMQSGLLSERDIVHGLADFGAALLGMTVADVMSRDMLTCTSDSRMEELMQQMTERRVRHLRWSIRARSRGSSASATPSNGGSTICRPRHRVYWTMSPASGDRAYCNAAGSSRVGSGHAYRVRPR